MKADLPVAVLASDSSRPPLRAREESNPRFSADQVAGLMAFKYPRLGRLAESSLAVHGYQ